MAKFIVLLQPNLSSFLVFRESIAATQKALGGPKPDESHSNTSCDTEVAAEDQDMSYTAAFSTSVQLHELTLDSEVLEAAVNQIRVYAETAREKLVFQLKKKVRPLPL